MSNHSRLNLKFIISNIETTTLTNIMQESVIDDFVETVLL